MKREPLSRLRTAPALFVLLVCSLRCHAADPPVGAVVAAIRTASGNYLTAVNGGRLGGPSTGPAAVALHTDSSVAGPWETFTVVWLNSTYTQFALRTSDGHFVTAVKGGGVGGPNDTSAPIHTDAKTIGIWERLTLNFLPNNQLTIKAPSDRFLTAVDGGGIGGSNDSPIHTEAVKPAEWETFTLVTPVKVSGDKGPPAGPDLRPGRPADEIGGCFVEPKESNPANLFLQWKCGPLFDTKTATADVVTQATLDFLTKYADRWQLKNPAKELKRRYAQPNWDVEFQQWNGGARVFNTDIHVSFINGVPSWVRSNYIPGLDSLNKSPKFSGAQAIELARKHLATTAHISLEEIRSDGKPMLGISAAQRDEPARPPRLIYRLTLMFSGRVTTPTNGYGVECEIDAHTGEVIGENSLRPLTARPIR